MRPHSSLRRDSAVLRLFGLLLAAALFAGGCSTTAMKGTPFYEGDHDRREGPSEDRVNLWPIAYYRAPALSVLWPLGEFADDRTVVRPFVSMYRENENAPYDEINVLWPLAQFDRRSGDNRVFPVFWGDTPDGGSYLNVFPLYDRRCESDGSRSNRLLLGLLGGWRTDAEGEAAEHWLFPLWYRDAEDDTVASLLWAQGEGWTAVPPLLSWRMEEEDGGTTTRALLGLGGWRTDAAGEVGENWLFPLWYRDPARDMTVSPLWASGRDWTAVPPLLSWRTVEEDGGATTHALLGLGGWRTDATGGVGESWLFPLWYRNAASDRFLSALWASGGDWSAIPPLLAWRTEEPDGGALTLALLGLGGWRTDSQGEIGENWLFPLWYHDAADDRFVSALWAHGRDWAAVPPLLSWRTEEADGGSTTRALLGLGGWRTDADGEVGKSWLFPLWYRDAASDRFLSALWASGRDWSAVPPLLSWRTEEADGGSLTRALLGLGGWRINANGEVGTNWLLPLWYRDATSLYTPLFGHDDSGGDRIDYWLTPLVGARSGDWTGSWFFPFYTWAEREETGEHLLTLLLLGGASRDDGGIAKNWLFPLWSDTDNPIVDQLLAEMHRTDGARPQSVWTCAREHTWLLLGLAGSKREVTRGVGHVGWDELDRIEEKAFMYHEEHDTWAFPLWDGETHRAVAYAREGGDLLFDGTYETESVLWRLWDRRREFEAVSGHEYERTRVLWRLYHDETLDGDRSIDIFPGITIDRRKDGYRKTSVLWRLFRYESDPEKGDSLDVLFIPILRP